MVMLNWIALTGADTGNSDITGYSLVWDDGVTATDPTAISIELIKTLALTYT
jgi:hypothetical protein